VANISDTGFAEFTSGLLAGVLDAVIGAQLDQARKLAELRQAAALGDDAFARTYIGDAQVEAAIAARVAAGEDPPPDDMAVRLALAGEQRALLQATLDRGLPRLLVDHGRVSARLMFSVEQGAGGTSVSPLLSGVGASARLRVTPVHARGPEFLRLQTNVTSEVEIAFKTVTE